ncbi:contact-dependent growth inhibition system immunity protein [Larkinella sp. VNQ87]|uniref:contact-dependent growth inhibition system immunity protein n=1 Tax=Larkinella sp. VNQ87 TaxID=3400921 RepID=UPI003C120AB7
MEENWQTQTLETLEEQRWEEPDFADNRQQKIQALRQTPLTQFSIEDIRFLIENRVSLPYLIPLALEKLNKNPFCEGDYYPGDLLQSVLNVDLSFWLTNRSLWQYIHQLIIKNSYELEDRGINTEQFLELS